MVYVDTSVLVALIVTEPGSAAMATWYAGEKANLASAAWCVTEFGSALGIKQRTGQLHTSEAEAAWQRFERLVANDLRLLPVEPTDFHRAALLTLDAASGIRAGDALHLACAERAGVKRLVTLDDTMAKNAMRVGIRPVTPGQ